MFSLNRYPDVLLYFRNWCNIFRHGEKPFWNFCWWESLKTFGSICFSHFYFLDSKIIFWSTIRRLHKTKWRNWKWLLGIHEKNSTNDLFETFVALVSASSLHWYHADLPTFAMDHKTFKENSVRPRNRHWNHCPLTSYSGRLGCHKFLPGDHRLVRWEVPASVDRCPWSHDVFVLLFLTFDKQARRVGILLRYLD